MEPERAASMLNPRPEEGAENLGGSIRVNGDDAAVVRRRLRIPMRLRVGERPAGAERGVDLELVLTFGTGERAERMGRWDEMGVALMGEERSLGEGGALVRKKLTGLVKVEVSLQDPSGALERFGDRKMIGSIFS
jgi:hypothetical protein